MSNFQKIYATNQYYIDSKNRNLETYNDFKLFAENLSTKAGNVKKNSGKASSYAGTLIKFTVLYKLIFDQEILPDELGTFAGLRKLEKIVKLDDFKEFNKKEDRFYSATFNCFRAYLVNKNLEIETIMDDKLNNSDYSFNFEKNNNYEEKSPKLKRDKVKIGTQMAYPRSQFESYKAKVASNWTCEINPNHKTFLSEIDGKNFVESHHLIPMAAQDCYDMSLDFADNIVTLCPNCHRLVHHSTFSIKREAIAILFKKRKNLFKCYGIEIDKKTLESFYNII